MNEPKVYNGPDGTQVGLWKRVWLKPQATIDTHCDPHSESDFVKVTKKKGVMGSLWDRSSDLSEARAQKNGGVDPVKEAFYANWSKKRKGQLHPEKRREVALKAAAKMGIKIKMPK